MCASRGLFGGKKQQRRVQAYGRRGARECRRMHNGVAKEDDCEGARACAHTNTHTHGCPRACRTHILAILSLNSAARCTLALMLHACVAPS